MATAEQPKQSPIQVTTYIQYIYIFHSHPYHDYINQLLKEDQIGTGIISHEQTPSNGHYKAVT